MDYKSEQFIAFGDFVLDLDRGLLRSSEGNVALRPKSLAVLKVLLDQAGRLVTKEVLMEAVWPGVIVGDDTLTQSIGELRRALGDPERKTLKTLPRRGYLLDVEIVNADARVDDMAGQRENSRREIPSRLFVFLIGVLVLVVTLISVSRPPIEPELDEIPVSTVNVTPRPRIVVPLFSDLTGRADLDYLAKGLWRDIVAELGRDVTAIAFEPGTIMGLDETASSEVIAERFDSNYVLRGSITDETGVVRFVFSLYDLEAKAEISEFDITQANLDALSVRRQLGAKLGSTLGYSPSSSTPMSDVSSEAYDHYLRAKILLDGMSPESHDMAQHHLREATEIEPTLAPAWREMARLQVRLIGEQGKQFTVEDVRQTYSLLNRALNLAPTDAATHAYIAWYEININGDTQAGVERLAEAVQLNPYDQDVIRIAIFIAYAFGDLRSAIDFAHHSRRYHPLCKACLYTTIKVLMAQRDYANAFVALERFNTLYPGAYSTAARLHLLAGDAAAALDAAQLERDLGFRREIRLMVFHAMGERDQFATELNEFLANNVQDFNLRSRLFSYVGDNDRAFANLEKLVTASRSFDGERVVRWNSIAIGSWLRNPEFATLRADPRWGDFLRRHRLDYPDNALSDVVELLPSMCEAKGVKSTVEKSSPVGGYESETLLTDC